MRFAAYRMPDVAAFEALKERLFFHRWTWEDVTSPMLAMGSISVLGPDGNQFQFGMDKGNGIEFQAESAQKANMRQPTETCALSWVRIPSRESN